MSAPDYHVVAWNHVDAEGQPIILINEDMTREDYEARVAGKYAASSVSLLRAISSSEVDAALDREFG